MNCSDVNAWLDMLMDDELSDEMRRELEAHAEICPECAENIKATIEMKELLSGMDDEADVPLATQAAWRKAVKQEAARMKYRKFYRAAGAVAAALVVMVGVRFAFINNEIDSIPADSGVTAVVTNENADAAVEEIAVIESDGSEMAAKARIMPEPVAESAPAECVLSVDDVEKARGYINDLVAEYEGSIETQNADGEASSLTITIPTENIVAFISAARHLDSSGVAFNAIQPSADEMTTMIIVLGN